MITIIDYNAGNLKSVERAVKYLGIPCTVTNNPNDVAAAKKIIFPGVGSARSAMDNLKNMGLDKALTDAKNNGVPILGICLGAQIILSHSEEGDTDCLGLIKGSVKAFVSDTLKIPQIGWNSVKFINDHPVFKGITDGSEFYFVHSFYPNAESKNNVFGITDYGIDFSSAIGSDNLVAVQFHPEKSGRLGLKILENFSQWNGRL